MIITPLPVDLVQNSDAWADWRAEGIGASDVAAVLGVSPWTDPDTLWAEKLGLQERRPQTDAMKRGNDLEPQARFILEWEHGTFYRPQCFTALEYPFLKASLDGWNKPVLAEFKCPGKTSHTKHLRKGCPAYYEVQVQFQLALSGGEMGWFCSYNPDFPADQQFCAWPIKRDDDHIHMILERAIAFYRCLERAIPPSEGMLTQSVNGIFQPAF